MRLHEKALLTVTRALRKGMYCSEHSFSCFARRPLTDIDELKNCGRKQILASRNNTVSNTRKSDPSAQMK